MTYIEDDLLPTRNEVGTGARLQVTDGLAGTPTTVNGPTVTTILATGRAAIGGHEVGDTGLRDVSADLQNGWTGSVGLRRHGNSVYLTAMLTIPADPGSIFYTLPAGFRMPANTDPWYNAAPAMMWSFGTGSGTAIGAMFVSSSLSFPRRDPLFVTGVDIRIGHSWSIDEAWPTGLPGIPAAAS